MAPGTFAPISGIRRGDAHSIYRLSIATAGEVRAEGQ
jgi:hypothetical protein